MKNFSCSILLLLCSLLYTSTSLAQEAPLLDWAKNIGAVLYNGGNGIATDASGNVYTTGNFFSTQDFDPGPGVFNMSVTGSDDGIFISKLNSSGDFVWAKSIKNVYNTADAIGIDASGNVIIAGFFDKGDVMDFDPGPGTFNLSAAGYDMFVLKLTADGDFVWVKHIKGGGAAAHAFPESLALDAAGNIYTTGYFQTTIDFDPGAGTFNLTAGEFRDIFIFKLDADGNFVWAKAMLGAGTCGACDDKARSIALDAAGNVYTNGFLRGTADFDPGPSTFNLTPASGGGFFVSKLDNNGNFIWAKTFGGAASGVADVGDMALDASGNIITTGGIYGTSDFDPGSGIFNLTSAGSSDIFICKLSGDGDFVWAKLFGAGSFDYATTLDTDGAGNIYTAGNFNGTIDFDPGAGTYNLTGGSDYFLQKLDTDGNFVWAYSMNSGFDMSIKVQLPNLYITGQMQAGISADLDPGPCILNSNPGAVFTKKLRLGTAVASPTISSFSPVIGPIGTSVTITGTGFSSTTTDNVVKFFNNRTATVTASTATSITALVPASTVTGVVSVTTNCLTASSATNFTIGPAPVPTITSFAPGFGPVGTTLNITGTNFSATPSGNIVFFGATKATVTAATTTQLTVTVPTGATYAPITVLNATTSLLAYSTTHFTPTFLPNKGSITAADFDPKIDFTTGTNSRSVSIADLDGDSKADLAVTNYNSNTISILRNNGTGNISYTAKVDLSSGSFLPNSVSIGDLDGDGKPDLAVANYSSGNNVSIFRNTSTGPGNISFASRIDFTTGSSPSYISISDLDGDGKADLAVANYSSNTVSVLRNTSTGVGNISYATKVDFTTGSFPTTISVADLDSDGKVDLVLANQLGNTVSVFRNTSTGAGSISYATKTDFPTGTQPFSVSIGDLDADGKADLAVTNALNNSVSVFRNTSLGAGSINYAARVNFTTGAFPSIVSIGDLDGDSKADLAVSNYNSNTVSVLRSTSTGAGNIGYASKVDFSTGTEPYHVAIGDSDGDGKADLVIANHNSNTVSVIRNNLTISNPTITSFTPTSGTVGTTVVITGTNFSTITSNNTVTFNGTTAVVSASTATSITVTVPPNATTGKITVTIAGNTATSATDYTVATGPVISITTQPILSSVCNGASATFTAAATGTANITYQWQFATSQSGNYSDISNGNGYVNATTASLSVNTTGNFGAGFYRCRISGDIAATVFTNGAQLTITTCTGNQPPDIQSTTIEAPVNGIVTLDLAALLSDPDNNLDLSTLKIIVQPLSGARASIDGQSNLILDYTGISFSGTEKLTLEVCDLLGSCAQNELDIEVAGDIVIYNAVSPNGDQKNDFLFLQYIDVLEETRDNHVTILNRWGSVVWESDNYDNTSVVFKGQTKNGNDLPNGNYFYAIEFSGDYKKRTGFFALKR